jgi:hypothetical protein
VVPDELPEQRRNVFTADPRGRMHTNASLELTMLHGQGVFEISFLLQDGERACRIALPLFGEGQPTGAAPDQWYPQPRLKRGKAFAHR